MFLQSRILISPNNDLGREKLASILQVNVHPHHITEIFVPQKKKSIGIEDISIIKSWNSTIAESLQLTAIYEADLLTTQAQNSLLKLTEEPYPNKLLVFVTQNPYGLLETIRSRCIMVYEPSALQQTREKVLSFIESSFMEREKILLEVIQEQPLFQSQLFLERVVAQLVSHDLLTPHQVKIAQKLYEISTSLQSSVQRKLLANTFNVLVEQYTK